MNFDEIERILELMRAHDLVEFELEGDGLKVRVRKGPGGAPQVTHQLPAGSPVPFAEMPTMQRQPPVLPPAHRYRGRGPRGECRR